MTRPRPGILLFAEDPSAANYLIPLWRAINTGGAGPVHFFAAGAAERMARAQGVPLSPCPPAERWPEQLRALGTGVAVVGTAENPDTAGLDIIDACRRLGIPSAGVVDALMNAETRFRGRTSVALTHAPDRLFVPDALTADAFADLGMAPGRIEIVGHPQYDRVIGLAGQWAARDLAAERARLFPGAPPSRKVVVFVSEAEGRFDTPPWNLPGHFALRGRGRHLNRTRIALEELLDAAASLSPRPWIVLRTHPIESAARYEEYSGELGMISGSGDPLALVHAADLVVGLTSMLLLEAALLGVRTLSILPREDEGRWLASIRAGITPVAASRDAVASELRSALEGDTLARVPPDPPPVVVGAIDRLERFVTRARQRPGSRIR